MTECLELNEFPSGEIEQIALVHGHNMETAGICAARHNALVKRLKELQKSEEED